VCDEEMLLEAENELKKLGAPYFIISAVTGDGVRELIEGAWETIKDIPVPEEFEPTYQPVDNTEEEKFTVRRVNEKFVVEGKWIERIMSTTNTDDYESLMNLQKLLKREGVFKALEKAGVEENDTVDLCGFEFEYVY
jgi:GTP-binding protein